VAESFTGLPNFWARQIDVVGNLRGGGTVQASYSLDLINDGAGGAPDFQTFALPPTFTNLQSVMITGSGSPNANIFIVDNLRMTTIPIPEPGSVTLAVVGVAAAMGVVGVRRCRAR
jgi:hypothetical protein